MPHVAIESRVRGALRQAIGAIHAQLRARRLIRLRVPVSMLALVAACLQAGSGAARAAENNTDRPGGDLGAPIELEFKQGSFLTFEAECEGLCKQNARCKAWTMVKPGVQGQKARCWLKGSVPRAVANKCCSSGVKAAESGGGTSSGGISFYQIVNDLFPNPGTPNSCNSAYAKCQAIVLNQFGSLTGASIEATECRPRLSRCLQTAAAAQGGGGTTGGGGGVPAEWADMLKAHNDKRKLHCVPPLTWSAQLAAEAQVWADACTNQHEQGISAGENLAFWTPSASNRQAFQNTWYCEIDHYDFDNPQWVGGFKNGCDPPVNGHFTQVVWKDSRELGCAKKSCDGGVYFVCRYSPRGNVSVKTISKLRAQVLPPTCN